MDGVLTTVYATVQYLQAQFWILPSNRATQCAMAMRNGNAYGAAATHPRMECHIVHHCERARAVGVRARTWRCEEFSIGHVRRRNPGTAGATHICPEKASAASLRRLSADPALTSRAADLAPTGAPSSRHETGSVCAPAIEAGRTAGRVGQASVGRKSAHNDFAAKVLRMSDERPSTHIQSLYNCIGDNRAFLLLILIRNS